MVASFLLPLREKVAGASPPDEGASVERDVTGDARS
jgi:hypothetical protein